MDRYIAIWLLLAGLVQGLEAKSIEGVQFPEELVLQKNKLVLNGLGLRKATIFNVRVYAAGLYVPKPAKAMSPILSDKGPKQLDMVFVRDVDVDSMRDAWDDSFERNCANDCKALEEPLKRLKAFLQPAKEGQKHSYQFLGDKLVYLVDGVEKGAIQQPGFPDFLLSTWLGKHPPNSDLRDGLLGLEDAP